MNSIKFIKKYSDLTLKFGFLSSQVNLPQFISVINTSIEFQERWKHDKYDVRWSVEEISKLWEFLEPSTSCILSLLWLLTFIKPPPPPALALRWVPNYRWLHLYNLWCYKDISISYTKGNFPLPLVAKLKYMFLVVLKADYFFKETDRTLTEGQESAAAAISAIENNAAPSSEVAEFISGCRRCGGSWNSFPSRIMPLQTSVFSSGFGRQECRLLVRIVYWGGNCWVRSTASSGCSARCNW
jgi:hypothetical protein